MMEYRKFEGTPVSASLLGFGCMRLPKTDPQDDTAIDRPEAIRMIRHAIDSGVNYIDTAYGYHGGESERVVGEALRDGYRERVQLATKLPQWLVHTKEDMYRLLDEQLEKLGVAYIDFYLIHAIGREAFDKMHALGVLDFLDEMVEKGKIKYPSFSFHDDAAAFRHIIDAYPWKMAQVQLNILDEENQATLEGVRYAKEKGVNIVVMEPLRGGALAGRLPQNVQALYGGFAQQRTPVEWAFRYLYDMPQVSVILSGMSDMAQVEDNLRIFSQQTGAGCMDAAEHKLMADVRAAYLANQRVGCTGCAYCMPCPAGVDIPENLRSYDRYAMFGNLDTFGERYAQLVAEDKHAGKCVDCGQCEQACPQHIQIRRHLADIQGSYGK